jgi:orotate phosphoribosyltransferase
MIDDPFDARPARRGHFRLESGLHTDLWLTLDALFARPRELAPRVAVLADRLRPHGVSAVCGPLVGGAFLAHALALALGAEFHYGEPVAAAGRAGLFAAEYRLPAALRERLAGARVALVDDVISAGSSVRATAAALAAAGAVVAAVGTLLALGDAGVGHFAGLGVPVEALARREFALWTPEDCPLCRAGAALEETAQGRV